MNTFFSAIYTTAHCVVWYCRNLTQFCQGHRFSAVVNENIVPAISVLLSSAGPSAVAGFVVSIVIRIAINGHSVWLTSHIAQKVFKTGIPSFAHRDSTTAIIGVGSIGRVITALTHMRPNIVRSCGRGTVGRKSFLVCGSDCASTGCSVAGLEVIFRRLCQGAAFALTKPVSEVSMCGSRSDYFQMAKA